MKRTFQPKNRQEKKEHGFMKRMKTKNGRNVLKARRAKGRKKLSAKSDFFITLPERREEENNEKNKNAKKKL